MYNLTLGDIQRATEKYRYIALRSGPNVIGINCRIPKSCPPGDEHKKSIFESFRPITFSEYIRIKIPFFYAHYFLKADQYSS